MTTTSFTSDVTSIIKQYLTMYQIPTFSGFNPYDILSASNHDLNYPPNVQSFYKDINVCVNPKLKSRHITLKLSPPFNQNIQTILTSVSSITINCSDLRTIQYIPSLPKIQKACFVHCSFINNFLHQTPNLRALEIHSSSFEVSFIKNVKKINYLKIKYVAIPNIKQLFENPQTHIKKLVLESTNFPYGFPKNKYIKLKTLVLINILQSSISYIGNSSIQHLLIKKCPISTLPPLPICKTLYINDCLITDFSFVADYPNIECIKLVKCVITQINKFILCKKLKRLCLSNCKIQGGALSIDKFSQQFVLEINNGPNTPKNNNYYKIDYSYELQCNKIDAIDESNRYINSCTFFGLTSSPIKNLNSLAKYKKLTCAHIYKCMKLEDISGLMWCPNLFALAITSCPKLINLIPLSGMKNLKMLLLYECSKNEFGLDLSVLLWCPLLELLSINTWDNIESLSVFPSCIKSIKYIEIKYCNKLLNVERLSSWENLNSVYINECLVLKSIPIIKSLQKLRVLACENLEDLNGLFECDELVELKINRCPKVSVFMLHTLRKKIGTIKIMLDDVLFE